VDFALDPAAGNDCLAAGRTDCVSSSTQIFNELPKLGDIDRLLNEAPSFGDTAHGPGIPDVPGSDRAIPTNEQLDLLLTGSSGRTDDNFTNDDGHSVEMLTRSATGLFRTFSSLMGYVDQQAFQSVTSQPNYKIPKRLNDPTNDNATLGINSAAGTFHNGSGTLVQSAARDQEVIDYYRDIARFLRGFGVASIANPDGDAATQAVAVAQVQGLLDPANYATPEEFLTAYDALRSQFEVAGTFRSDITITLPQQAEVGIEVKPLPRLRLTSDVKWIDYSDAFQQFAATLRDADNPVFQRFLGLKPEPGQLDFGQVNDFTFKEELNWHDQWVFSFGTAYDLLDNFTVMAGYSFTGRRLNDLWNNFGEAQSAMDGENNMAMLPAFGYETGSVGFSYRWNNKEISFALERAFTTTVFSGSPNQANSQYSNSQESANQDTVHVQYSLAF